MANYCDPRVTKRKNRQHKLRSREANLAARAVVNQQRAHDPRGKPCWSAPTGPAAPHRPNGNTAKDLDDALYWTERGRRTIGQ